mmetsp:Transcript_25542/g.55378  ORF Transcript_25542/g.55378 Transcript_25542/m.55378 type:complete len:81 (+) Transcript_25542:1012-1254(+)
MRSTSGLFHKWFPTNQRQSQSGQELDQLRYHDYLDTKFFLLNSEIVGNWAEMETNVMHAAGLPAGLKRLQVADSRVSLSD